MKSKRFFRAVLGLVAVFWACVFCMYMGMDGIRFCISSFRNTGETFKEKRKL